MLKVDNAPLACTSALMQFENLSEWDTAMFVLCVNYPRDGSYFPPHIPHPSFDNLMPRERASPLFLFSLHQYRCNIRDNLRFQRVCR